MSKQNSLAVIDEKMPATIQGKDGAIYAADRLLLYIRTLEDIHDDAADRGDLKTRLATIDTLVKISLMANGVGVKATRKPKPEDIEIEPEAPDMSQFNDDDLKKIGGIQ